MKALDENKNLMIDYLLWTSTESKVNEMWILKILNIQRKTF